MNDQQLILKTRIRDLIRGRNVKAALFYTFNFDPKFFENYVMPLLVPQHTFINNSITNNILWRKLYNDNEVPPVTVYFDQDAKSTVNGPYLDYKLVPVNMPMVGKNKGNFHPKHSLILVKGDNNVDELIVISGSNNLTQSGWCENIECVSEHQLINDKEYPYEFRKDIKEFIRETLNTFGKVESDAESQLLSYLQKISYKKERELYFFNSFKGSFQAFLNKHVLTDNTLELLEIVSPYFHKKPDLLNECKTKVSEIRIEAPYRQNYCLLDKTVFDSYKDAGFSWHRPKNDSRNNHSKVYRFYGDKKVYTIIGSVNLTAPAWKGYDAKPKSIFNIESAILYVDKRNLPSNILGDKIGDGQINFLPATDPIENWHERIEIPDLEFTINWIDKSLSWKGRTKNDCVLSLTASETYSINGTKKILFTELKNGEEILSSISRKPILTVIEKVNDKEQIHNYYVNQIGFESKPLEFRFSVTDIIDAWDLLGSNNVEMKDWLINRLELATDLLQDESGKMLAEKTAYKSLLNEMARHFYGLVKLESFLFDESVIKKRKEIQSIHCNNLRYYLTCDNVDTLCSYIKDLGKLHKGSNIMTVYYWLLLNIILAKFYENRNVLKMLRTLHFSNLDVNKMKMMIKKITDELKEEIGKVKEELKLDNKKMTWGLSILQNNYGVS